MRKIVSILVIITVIFTACTDNKQSKIDKIKDLEKKMNSKTDSSFSIAKQKELVTAYIDFAESYPDDTSAATCYYNAAKISMYTDPKKAVEYYDKVISDYPNFRKMNDCMFQIAFTYDNYLKDIKKAKEAYEAFIKKYPNDDFADDAQSLIDMLGKTDQQIAAELQAKNKKDTLETSNQK